MHLSILLAAAAVLSTTTGAVAAVLPRGLPPVVLDLGELFANSSLFACPPVTGTIYGANAPFRVDFIADDYDPTNLDNQRVLAPVGNYSAGNFTIANPFKKDMGFAVRVIDALGNATYSPQGGQEGGDSMYGPFEPCKWTPHGRRRYLLAWRLVPLWTVMCVATLAGLYIWCLCSTRRSARRKKDEAAAATRLEPASAVVAALPPQGPPAYGAQEAKVNGYA
ncbi:hypothetical protein JCM10213_004568 [Rhodosporidiobolus nylandii]